MQPIKLDIVF